MDEQHLLAMLQRIEHKLDLLLGQPLLPPNEHYPLSLFTQFDWGQLEAEVLEMDGYGPTQLRWRGNGQVYYRRCPTNKKRAAVWFSRYIGTNELGTKQYERLVTFSERPRPRKLDQRVVAHLGATPQRKRDKS